MLINHIHIYHYDFSDEDVEVSSIDELEDKLTPRAFQIRIGSGMKLGQDPTLLGGGSDIISGRGQDIIQTPLGRLPIGFVSVHLGNNNRGHLNQSIARHRSCLSISRSPLPFHVYNLLGSVSAAAVGAYWSLYTYDQLNSLDPDANSRIYGSLTETIETRSDSELSALLSELYDQQHEVTRRIQTLDAEFASIGRVTETYTSQLRSDSALHPLINAGKDFTTVCETRISQYSRIYEQYIERVRNEVEVNVGVVGKQISYAVLTLTSVSIIIQVPPLFNNISVRLSIAMRWGTVILSFLLIAGVFLFVIRK